MKSVLIAASCWNSSSTLSTPSSTNDTAPTCIPIILEAGGAAGEFCATEASAPAAAFCRKLLRFIFSLLLDCAGCWCRVLGLRRCHHQRIQLAIGQQLVDG